MPARKIVNWEGGSDARYDVSGLPTVDGRKYDGTYYYDMEGRPLDAIPGGNEWTQGLPGARGGGSPSDGGGGQADGGGAGIPGAAVWGQMVANGLAEYKKALARLNQNRQSTMTQYGYAADIDPETGTMKNMRVDPSNPFGLYQGRRRSNARQYAGLRDAAMERRIGTKGLGAQGISDARWEWGAADTAMAQALSQTTAGYDESQNSAWQAYQNLKWQAELEAARAAAMRGGGYGYGGGGGGGDDGGGEPVYQGVTQPGATEGDPNARPQDLLYRPTYQVTPKVTTPQVRAAQQLAPKAVKALGDRYNAMAKYYNKR